QCSVPRSLWLGCSNLVESMCALRCLQSMPSVRCLQNTSGMEDQNEDESPKKNTVWQITNGPPSMIVSRKRPSGNYEKEKDLCIKYFDQWSESDQVEFVEHLISRMCHYQHGHINSYLKPMLQRDFITALPAQGLDHIAENILSYLDAKSLCAAEVVCKEWQRVIGEGMLWKKLIERMVRTDPLWRGLAERRGWEQYLFKNRPADGPPNSFYRGLYPKIIQDIETIESNWRCGRHNLQRIQCRSENSKGVYCLQVWDVNTAEVLNTLIHHNEAVLHLRFSNGLMVTCSKDRSIAVWDMASPTDITLRRVLVGHRAAVNVVDFDDKYIVSASGDRTIKVWSTSTCEFVRTLNGHKRGIACLQYRDRLVVSGSSDNTIRLWDIECGACLRVLEGHEELVRCIRFDNKRIVSGAYDGKIKVWDLQAALDPRAPASTLCLRTLVEHSGRVFRLQMKHALHRGRTLTSPDNWIRGHYLEQGLELLLDVGYIQPEDDYAQRAMFSCGDLVSVGVDRSEPASYQYSTSYLPLFCLSLLFSPLFLYFLSSENSEMTFTVELAFKEPGHLQCPVQ
ncbi:hypothetical protein chiPu_0017765, partial [Chiloscyllium punctatum]|nr:hypothetical protein [Chiloscyllium punctatum]